MTINGKTLVQVTSNTTGESVGLYFVPTENIEKFEKEIGEVIDQSEFDETNNLGVERIFADDVIVDIKF